MCKSECLHLVSSIGAVWQTRRHVWQKLCMQVFVTEVGTLYHFQTPGNPRNDVCKFPIPENEKTGLGIDSLTE